ncbi:DNA translocase FtsK [Levilactobacillus wangkuiensis]|uniref:DNA translocase FtsK n=1 Tax=Levilactobacillus wangkuiensis TaxID=2799566 RepID=UPI0019443139|nr:DNA translocase FtsK [Levilactobacillus wangkuiensis]
MEHYDGPAFYRKFPVEPTPEQMDDTTDERSERQVRLRKERNDRLRLRQQREEKRETAAQSAAQAVLHQTKQPNRPTTVKPTQAPTASAPTPEEAAAAASANYRPFAVTQIPKQRSRVWQPAVLRKRYQRLIASFHKDDASFLLYGTAADEAALNASATDTPTSQAAPTVVFTPDSAATASSQAITVRSTADVVVQQPASTPVVQAESATTSATVLSAEPVESVATSEDKATATDETAASVAETAVDEVTPVTSETPNGGTGSTELSDTAETPVADEPQAMTNDPETDTPDTSEVASESVADNNNNNETETVDAAEATTMAADPTESVSTTDQLTSEAEVADDSKTAESTAVVEPAPTEIFYPEQPADTATSQAYLPVDNQPAPVGEVADAITSDAETVASAAPADQDDTDANVTEAVEPTETSADEDEPATPVEETAVSSTAPETTSAATEKPTTAQPAEVTELLRRAEAPESAAAATPEPDQAATEPETGSAANAGDDDNSAPVEPESTANTTPQPAKPVIKAKAKPTRGLGHSLGDIMQEEGNDQRNLALFDRPAATPAPAEEATPERGYHFPDLSLLPKPVVPDEEALDEWIEHQAEVLDATLSAFHVDAHVTDWTVGPTVTQFQISLALGVKVNKITNLNDDLKLALAAKDIRIEAPIPGKTTVGIEIPNVKSRPVMLSEILNSAAFKNSESPLTVALGVDLFGKPQVTDLRKMPHGLIAGATGSGKSVFINSLLLSILYKATPAQVKLLLIDPKAVEMAPYDALPHLLSPVISDPKAAAAALKWVVTEMDERYEKLAAAGVRNIEQFNDRADANDEPSLKMPYIVIIIDELADLMMMAASEVQDYIVRITQKARAAGIHLLVATQRPSVDIVTGTIKNNIPTRIAFMVSSQIDSRTILDTAGAENLLGRGDMLYLGNGASQPMRLQGAFVESEVDGVTDFVRTQGQPHYAFEPKGLLQRETAEENQDELLPKVLEYIAQEKSVSTSKLQRVFSIGYNRAANLIDDLEQHHYVSPQHGSKPREVYLTPEDLGKDLPEPHDQGAPFSS